MERKDDNLWITGLVPAVFTPMHSDGTLNLDRVPEITESLISDGANGLYVCGSTGEGPSLTTDERRAVATAYVQAADGRVPVVVQVGHNSIRQAQELSEHARVIGADAISTVAPSYFSIDSLDTVIACLSEIAAGAPDLPLYYYHIPRLTNTRIDLVSLLERAAESIPSLRGIKFSDFAVHEMHECTGVRNGAFNILFGADEMLLSGIVAKAHGAVGTTYNFAMPLFSRVISAHERHEMAAAEEAQVLALRMIRIADRFTCGGSNLPALKSIMKMIGLDCGPPRLPLCALSEQQESSLRDELTRVGFFQWGRSVTGSVA